VIACTPVGVGALALTVVPARDKALKVLIASIRVGLIPSSNSMLDSPVAEVSSPCDPRPAVLARMDRVVSSMATAV
jgi:hypothetical protein